MKTAHMPAFPWRAEFKGPTTDTIMEKHVPDGHVVVHDFAGMTLRDHFAGLAMQALIHVQVSTKQVQTAESAYQWADAMIKARDS